jgi:Tfp pilus assembly protein PilF
LNESLFPDASALHITRGNVYLMTGDTTRAAGAFRAALQKDPANEEARSRLRDIGRSP